jgi:hypothetical protein
MYCNVYAVDIQVTGDMDGDVCWLFCYADAHLRPLYWGGWLPLVGCVQLLAVAHQGGVGSSPTLFLVQALGTSWYRVC